ncbi:MAG: hypothetical protein R2798_07430 [Chitinophagales bacterium]|nr:polysaccharide deacetylase family protein [Bacteroidota bacterium]
MMQKLCLLIVFLGNFVLLSAQTAPAHASLVFSNSGFSPENYFSEGDTLHFNTNYFNRKVVALQKVNYFANGTYIGSSEWQSTAFSWVVNTAADSLQIYGECFFSDNTFYKSDTLTLYKNPYASPLNIAWEYPYTQTFVLANDSLPLVPAISYTLPEAPVLHITTSSAQSYDAVRMGNSSYDLWSEKISATTDNLTSIHFSVKDFNNTANWWQIELRAQGSSQSKIVLSDYINQTNLDENGWRHFSIPISDFCDCNIFDNISFLEWRNTGAVAYHIGISDVFFADTENKRIDFFTKKLHNNYFETVGNNIAANISGTLKDYVQEVVFYANEVLIGSSQSFPYTLNWQNIPQGTYQLKAILTDNNGKQQISNIVPLYAEKGVEDFLSIQLFFEEGVPDNISVNKARLRYNKAFAYSLTLDDADADAFSFVFPYFNGETFVLNKDTLAAEGCYFSDGCGNLIPFKAGIAWYSANSFYQDLHENNAADFLTWQQLTTLYRHDWDVFNHSFTHNTTNPETFPLEISLNTQYVFQKTGIKLTHFVVPGGAMDYVASAFAQGMKAVYNQTGLNSGFVGDGGLLNISNLNNSSLQYFKLIRQFKSVANTTLENISLNIDNAAALSQNGNAYWYNDFTHGTASTMGGGLNYELFDTYMQHINNAYGYKGNDNIWMAPLQEVYEYLDVMENAEISLQQTDSQHLSILINLSNVPQDLRRYALSLLVNCDNTFTIVSVEGTHNYTYNANTSPEKLINLQWFRLP